MNSEKLGLEEKLADPAIYQGPAGALRDAQIKLAAVNNDLAETEQAWLEACEAVDG